LVEEITQDEQQMQEQGFKKIDEINESVQDVSRLSIASFQEVSLHPMIK